MITCRVIGFVWVRADPNALKIKPPAPHWRGTDRGWRAVKIWSKSFSENRPEASWELVTKEHSVRLQETSQTSSKLNRIPHQTVQSCPHQCQHHTSLSHGTMNRASHQIGNSQSRSHQRPCQWKSGQPSPSRKRARTSWKARPLSKQPHQFGRR